jgi:predicted DNA-binding protein with PD1-like motif
MKTHAFRLTTGDDLKKSIEEYVRDHCIGAGYIISCVGGLSTAVLRKPGARDYVTLSKDLEIVSVQGTLSPEGCHLHASVSDEHGVVTGGHLSDGCIVRLTTEVALVDDTQFDFARALDETTGFNELVITRRASDKERR